MPHVIVKLWPGKSDAQKQRLADLITQNVIDVLHYGDESVSVAFEEIPAAQWKKKVYDDLLRHPRCPSFASPC
jgi:4-oxalocrotonate tautomerase